MDEDIISAFHEHNSLSLTDISIYDFAYSYSSCQEKVWDKTV